MVEDHDDTRHNLERLLGAWGYEVLAAEAAARALALARQHHPDVVVTDLVLPGLSGLDLLPMFKAIDPTLEVIFLTGEGTMEVAIAALREGQAFDFLHKPLRDVKALQVAIEKALVRRHRAQPAPAPTEAPQAPVEALSAREREVLQLLPLGLEAREIAERLSVSEKTVRNHLSHIYEKLGVANRMQAVITAQRLGLL